MSKSNHSNVNESPNRSQQESQTEKTDHAETRPGRPDTRPSKLDNSPAARPGKPDTRRS